MNIVRRFKNRPQERRDHFGFFNATGNHWNPGWHLNNGKQGIETAKGTIDGDTKNWTVRVRRNHTWQVGREAGPGDVEIVRISF